MYWKTNRKSFLVYPYMHISNVDWFRYWHTCISVDSFVVNLFSIFLHEMILWNNCTTGVFKDWLSESKFLVPTVLLFLCIEGIDIEYQNRFFLVMYSPVYHNYIYTYRFNSFTFSYYLYWFDFIRPHSALTKCWFNPINNYFALAFLISIKF